MTVISGPVLLPFLLATAVKWVVLYYRSCMINVAHPPYPPCGSANTTDAEPFDQVARLAVGGSPHAASAVTLLFSGESIRFVGAVSVVQMVGLWSSEICIGGRRARGSAWSSVMPQTPAGRPDACITSPSAPGQHRTVAER